MAIMMIPSVLEMNRENCVYFNTKGELKSPRDSLVGT